ncbi:MAG: DUF4129 domain-containing protein [Cellulomonadaceae bacterium]|jgi:hypothetical protein|nr:DUF4129 domain-containing protein [Cellulomonadaceae bacterium]
MTTLTTVLARFASVIPFADPPVEPTREEARRWLLEELARPEYSTSPSLLERGLDWLGGLFDRVGDAAAPPGQAIAWTLLAVAVVVAVAFLVAGPVRLARIQQRKPALVDDDDTRTAADLRAAADAAALRGEWTQAVAERFRAIIRALEERVIIDNMPGRTAQESAQVAADALPSLAARMHDAAGLFDAVIYGHLPAHADDDADLRSLDQAASAARPLRRKSDSDVGGAGSAGFDGETEGTLTTAPKLAAATPDPSRVT